MNAPLKPNENLETLARRAIGGDKDALGRLLEAMQGHVFPLALRMLWHRQDAEDATQEILVKIATRLSQFDFRSSFKTWAYRVASNHLIDFRKSPIEQQRLNFTDFGGDLAQGLDSDADTTEHSLLVEEVKIGCTLGMLQCLARDQRLAYVLGEVLEFSSDEAAAVVNVEPVVFRKRLQRAREQIEAFTRTQCGLFSDNTRCACPRRVKSALAAGRVHETEPQFAKTAGSFAETRSLIRKLDDVRQVVEHHRRLNPKSSARDFSQIIMAALE